MEKKSKIGSLWKRISKDGVEYLTGYINNQKVFIALNKYKTSSEETKKQPDYIVYEDNKKIEEN